MCYPNAGLFKFDSRENYHALMQNVQIESNLLLSDHNPRRIRLLCSLCELIVHIFFL